MATSPYLTALYRARRSYVRGVLPAARADLARAYVRALADVLRDEAEGRITAERADQIARLLRRALDSFVREADALVQQTQRSAIEGTQAGHEAGLTALGVPPTLVANAFVRLPDDAVRLMLARKAAAGLSASFRTLAAPHLQALHRDVDDLLISHVARGADRRATTRSLARMLTGDDVDVRRALDAVPYAGRRVKRLLDGQPEPEERDLRQARQTMYRARRIVLHESNTAWQSAQIVAAHESPVVGLVRWSVSGLHVAPDVCDILAGADVGYGPGLYRPESCPALPHPHCLCTPTPVIRPAAEWGRPMPPALPMRPVSEREALSALDAGERRVERRRGAVPLTDAGRRRALDAARRTFALTPPVLL